MWKRRAAADAVSAAAGFEAGFAALDGAGLRALTERLRRRLADGASPEEVLPEALAGAREAGTQVLGERATDEQVLGAAAMARGRLAEMKTGEGKTLAIAMAAYAWSLERGGVHVLTANDYLARRDAEWMGPVFEALGTTCALITAQTGTAERRAAYEADVTYGTCSELSMDYLRDNLANLREDLVQQRGPRAAIVDEADLVLIDQARLISKISAKKSPERQTSHLENLNRIVSRLDPECHVTVDRARLMVTLTAQGQREVEDQLGVGDLYQDSDADLQRDLDHVLRASFAYRRDRDYVVRDGRVSALDMLTGRLDTVVSLHDGLAQAIELKEGLKLSTPFTLLIEMSHRGYATRYPRLAAATGTALEERLYREGYGLEVERIRTHRPVRRIDHPMTLCLTETLRSKLAVEAIEKAFAAGRPVLVVASTITQSEQFADTLRTRGFTPEVLNAKNNEQEAEIITRAGRAGAVTVVTRMAGRGVDIKLGGEDRAEHEAVVRAGGLYVLGLDLFENRRLEMHVRGRAGRRGDPGESALMLSWEDESTSARFGKSVHTMLDSELMRKTAATDPIASKAVDRSLRRALDRSTARLEQSMLHMFAIDDVEQRQIVQTFAQRTAYRDGDGDGVGAGDGAGAGAGNRARVLACCEALVDRHAAAAEPGLAGAEKLLERLEVLYPVGVSAAQIAAASGSAADDARDHPSAPRALRALLVEDITRAYARREQELGEKIMRELERRVALATYDREWRHHMTAMDGIREDVTLHTLTGSDWLTRYQQQANRLLRETHRSIEDSIVGYIFNLEVQVERES